MEDLKQGTRVEFDIQSFKGKGTIVGVATNGQPIIGKSYKQKLFDWVVEFCKKQELILEKSTNPNRKRNEKQFRKAN